MNHDDLCPRCEHIDCHCCPYCEGTGGDLGQPIEAAGRCGACQGTGRDNRRLPEYEDRRHE